MVGLELFVTGFGWCPLWCPFAFVNPAFCCHTLQRAFRPAPAFIGVLLRAAIFCKVAKQARTVPKSGASANSATFAWVYPNAPIDCSVFQGLCYSVTWAKLLGRLSVETGFGARGVGSSGRGDSAAKSSGGGWFGGEANAERACAPVANEFRILEFHRFDREG